jgi:hypothetical protein
MMSGNSAADAAYGERYQQHQLHDAEYLTATDDFEFSAD